MKLLLLLAVCASLTRAQNDWDTVTAMDTYINRPESVYSYEKLNTYDEGDLTVLMYNMTSLTWFDDTLTTTPVWYHQMSIIIPKTPVITDKALLYTFLGNWDDAPMTNVSGPVIDAKVITRATGAPSSVIKQVPFQPLYFLSEGGNIPRVEDDIIGLTWQLYIEGNVTNPEIILLFPMTKAVKQAVDTVVSVCLEEAGLTITGIMPTGFSKRGWTSWLLGGMDRRVFAMAPNVFDFLNIHECMHNHYMSLGGWTWALEPYYNTEISYYVDHPRLLEIWSHIDPMVYNPRLTMPKLLSGATGDQFFLPDDTHQWWDSINGEMHYSIYENDHHGLLSHRSPLWRNIAAFFHDVHNGNPRPDYQFTYRNGTTDCDINLTSNTEILDVRVWTADSTIAICEPHNTTDPADIQECRRDFRLTQAAEPSETNIIWSATAPVSLGGWDYTVTVPKRNDAMEEKNFRITHMQFEASSGLPGYNYTLSSQTQIVPDRLPFPKCTSPTECRGVIK